MSVCGCCWKDSELLKEAIALLKESGKSVPTGCMCGACRGYSCDLPDYECSHCGGAAVHLVNDWNGDWLLADDTCNDPSAFCDIDYWYVVKHSDDCPLAAFLKKVEEL